MIDTSNSNDTNRFPKMPSYNPVCDHYLNTINEASRRSRITLIIMVTASVLAFAGFWNSMSSSWLRKRIETAKAAYDWYRFYDDSTNLKYLPHDSLFITEIQKKYIESDTIGSKKLDITKLLYGVNLRIPPSIKLEMEKGDLNLVQNILKNIKTDSIVHAAKFLITRNINSRRELANLLASWENAEIENVYIIRVPFFGVSFDINDLGIWSGIAFIIILFMFRFSLAREVKNLKYVFLVARKYNALETYYELISMHQVLTVPYTKNGEKIKFSEKLPICLFSSPLLVYLCVVIHDFCSLAAGFSISKWNTYLTAGISVIFLIIIIKSTFSCYKIWNEMNTEWKMQAHNLRIITTTS